MSSLKSLTVFWGVLNKTICYNIIRLMLGIFHILKVKQEKVYSELTDLIVLYKSMSTDINMLCVHCK